MMYRPDNSSWTIPVTHRRRFSLRRTMTLVVVLLVGTAAFCGFRLIGQGGGKAPIEMADVSVGEVMHMVDRVRLCRDQIPELNINTINYRQMFDDLNDIQLEAAQRNGLSNPEQIVDLDACEQLTHLESNSLYRIDSMTYSKPYLTPEAAMLLEYVGLRFQEVMQECYPDHPHHYRLVVTSALRSQEDVQRLRRRNRNATENSCHRFGTTMDISYIRFEREDGEDVNELFLKNVLSQALYELRYEGLCYVKYERGQSCFHMTVRNTEYKGKLKAQAQSFVDNAGIAKGDWGDDGTLDATEALSREYRQYGTVYGKPVGKVAPRGKSSRTATRHAKPKSAAKSSVKSAAKSGSQNTPSSERYRSVPAPGRSGEEGIMAW